MTKTAVVIGAGPAGLSAAEILAQSGVMTHVYERMASPARKFLMAGRGGLNLTHSEDFCRFLPRYGEASEQLRPFLEAFGPKELRVWCEGLEQQTFVGSSGRVFPKAFKASPLLRAWLRRLAGLGVNLHLHQKFEGFEGSKARFVSPEGSSLIEADCYVLALGGASWPRLGGDGAWVEPLKRAGLETRPLRPANCGLEIGWSTLFVEKFAGWPLKNISLRVGELEMRGECVITRRGLEGGVVYAISGLVRDQSDHAGPVPVFVDLRPDVSLQHLTERLAKPRGRQSSATFLRKTVRLNPLALALLRESGALPMSAGDLAARIKSTPLSVQGVSGLEKAISTAGGIRWDSLDENLMAKAFPGLFVAGEMLDWEAPTGGYLLTACFSTGRAAGAAAAKWLKA